jgi:uncharacterized protein
VPTEVVENPAAHRFEIVVDGKVAGFSEYHDRGGRRAFMHTEVDPSYEGQGLASRLVRFELDDARRRGMSVLPYCPFVRAFIDGHREDYLDLVPTEDRAEFDLAG